MNLHGCPDGFMRVAIQGADQLQCLRDRTPSHSRGKAVEEIHRNPCWEGRLPGVVAKEGSTRRPALLRCIWPGRGPIQFPLLTVVQGVPLAGTGRGACVAAPGACAGRRSGTMARWPSGPATARSTARRRWTMRSARGGLGGEDHFWGSPCPSAQGKARKEGRTNPPQVGTSVGIPPSYGSWRGFQTGKSNVSQLARWGSSSMTNTSNS